MPEKLEELIENCFQFRPNRNQRRDLERLIFEISRSQKIKPAKLLKKIKADYPIESDNSAKRFFGLKKALVAERFPISSSYQKIDPRSIYLPKIRPALSDNYRPQKTFKPLKIFVEKEVKNSYLVANFKSKFPECQVEIISSYSQYCKAAKFGIGKLKKPYVFIVKEKWDFLKPCPCTKYHLSCGYWILNLGFGCPYDCSYCFLQHYTNSPGIILPGNIDTFFEEFDKFSKKLTKPIRIGTGEFSDSLALDEITEYSKKLIPYFRGKNLLFELKTKSANIANLLKLKPAKNIIISWSLNPQNLINSEEIATVSLRNRLKAAKKVAEYGYGISFHFDPIIHSKNWETDYSKLIKILYSQLKPPFSWISLGTLRCNRKLKVIAEQRFRQSDIFYSELLLAEDKKLRYPKPLRKEIYQKMLDWIKQHDKKTPVYFCMEDKEIWAILGKSKSEAIEKYLIDQ